MRETWKTMTADERLAFVKAGILDRLTASQIASQIEGATRNAVIGLCHRKNLKLPGNIAGRPQGVAERSPRKPRAHVRPRTEATASAPPRKMDEPDESARPFVSKGGAMSPTMDSVSMLQLTNSTCRWPLMASYLGLPVDEMKFCGKPSLTVGPYCPECAARAKDNYAMNRAKARSRDIDESAKNIKNRKTVNGWRR